LYQWTLSYHTNTTAEEAPLEQDCQVSCSYLFLEGGLNRDWKLGIKDMFLREKMDIITMLCPCYHIWLQALGGAASQTVLEIGCNLETFFLVGMIREAPGGRWEENVQRYGEDGSRIITWYATFWSIWHVITSNYGCLLELGPQHWR